MGDQTKAELIEIKNMIKYINVILQDAEGMIRDRSDAPTGKRIANNCVFILRNLKDLEKRIMHTSMQKRNAESALKHAEQALKNMI